VRACLGGVEGAVAVDVVEEELLLGEEARPRRPVQASSARRRPARARGEGRRPARERGSGG